MHKRIPTGNGDDDRRCDIVITESGAVAKTEMSAKAYDAMKTKKEPQKKAKSSEEAGKAESKDENGENTATAEDDKQAEVTETEKVENENDGKAEKVDNDRQIKKAVQYTTGEYESSSDDDVAVAIRLPRRLRRLGLFYHSLTGFIADENYEHEDVLDESRALARSGCARVAGADLEKVEDSEQTDGGKGGGEKDANRKKKGSKSSEPEKAEEKDSEPEKEKQGRKNNKQDKKQGPPKKWETNPDSDGEKEEEGPRVPPIDDSSSNDGDDEDEDEDYNDDQNINDNGFTHPDLDDGLKSIFYEKGTWVKMTFPTIEQAHNWFTLRHHCVVGYYKSLGKMIVSPSQCKVIYPFTHSTKACQSYTPWIVGKVILNPDREEYMSPSNPEEQKGVNITKSQPGWPICHTCAYTFGHLGPYCISEPEHRLQSSQDYARYDAYLLALEASNGEMTDEVRKKRDIFNVMQDRIEMTTPFVSKQSDFDSRSCNAAVKQGCLWQEPLADFYHQMDFDRYHLKFRGTKKPKDRKFSDYAYKERLFGLRSKEEREAYIRANPEYDEAPTDYEVDWDKSREFFLPAFSPFLS